MSVSRISQIMHCGILIDMPSLLTKHNNPLHVFFQSLKYKPMITYRPKDYMPSWDWNCQL